MEHMTLQEIAMHEGVSHQRIEQILSVALKKFKQRLALKGIKLEDLL